MFEEIAAILATIILLVLTVLIARTINPFSGDKAPEAGITHVTNTVYIVEVDHIEFETNSLMELMESNQ